jgi:hypothetical protein
LAKIENRGFVDDGTKNLEIEGNLVILNDLTVLGTANLANLLFSNIFKIVQKTSSYTLTNEDFTVECISGSFDVTLLNCVNISGKLFNIKNSGSGSIRVLTTLNQTIDGQLNVTLSQYECLTVQSNGSNWIII